MSLNVSFWRLGTRAVRVVTADNAADEPTVDVSPGAMLFRMDTQAHRYFNGSAWVSSEGGGGGVVGSILLAQVYNPSATGGILSGSQYVP